MNMNAIDNLLLQVNNVNMIMCLNANIIFSHYRRRFNSGFHEEHYQRSLN